MSTLKATVQDDLHTAMRAQDKLRSGTLRMVLTAITNAEVAGTEHRELSDDDVLGVIAKEAKKRKEAAAAYTEAGRGELADRRTPSSRSSRHTCLRSSATTTSALSSPRRLPRPAPAVCSRWVR